MIKKLILSFNVLMLVMAGQVAAQGNSVTRDQITTLQETMVSDSEIMEIIGQLQEDPSFQKVLSDPAMIEAISSGDLDTLKSNPEFINLLNNSRVNKVRDKVME